MTTSKIRVRMGDIEVECEGTEAFIKTEVPTLLKAVSELHEGDRTDKPKRKSTGTGEGTKDISDGNIRGTTATLAGKLKVKSGNDLIVAAAAHLTFVANKPEFSRQELLEQVRGATGYYKESYSKNFTNYLSSRVKAGQLMEPRTGHYAISASELERLRSALAA